MFRLRSECVMVGFRPALPLQVLTRLLTLNPLSCNPSVYKTPFGIILLKIMQWFFIILKMKSKLFNMEFKLCHELPTLSSCHLPCHTIPWRGYQAIVYTLFPLFSSGPLNVSASHIACTTLHCHYHSSSRDYTWTCHPHYNMNSLRAGIIFPWSF